LSLASRTGLLDLQTQDWWPDALAWLDLPSGVMPRLVRAGTPIGRVRAGLLPGADGAVLTIGGHDHLCAAVGAGATGPDDVLNSCGTATALVRGVAGGLDSAAVERMVSAGIAVQVHVLEGQQALVTGVLEGFALRRFLRLLGVEEAERATLDQQAALVSASTLRVDGIDAPAARLTGIDQEVTPARVWRAALDAVERRLADLLNVMVREAGPHQRVVVVGGWARNPGVRAAKRAFLGPCVYADVDEAGVHGAALLAGLAAGVYPSVDAWPCVPMETPD
jgi:sugar (pentulose or hexulose) kinase